MDMLVLSPYCCARGQFDPLKLSPLTLPGMLRGFLSSLLLMKDEGCQGDGSIGLCFPYHHEDRNSVPQNPHKNAESGHDLLLSFCWGDRDRDPGADCSPSLAKYKPPSSREKAGLERKAVSRQRGTGSYSQHSSVRGRRILDLYELDSSKQSRAT